MVEEQGYDLYPLEDSKKEVRDISRHFPEDKSDIYLGKDATEEKLKQSPLEEYQVIHFACHGSLDEKVPFRSGLFLSLHEAKDEDGFLQASEIAGLNLTADLVVLSACRTSRGYVEKGEGVMGVTRTFFFSGASAVVSTLWKISDRATVEFMRHFYGYLAQGKDKAQALRLAKLRMLDSRYSHPFFWAAFVLHGESTSALSFR
jgi:CHAT domain-containing protein